MRKIKKILSLLLVFPVMLVLCACGGDPENPPTTGGGGSQGTESSLTVSDSFSVGEDLVDVFFENYTEDDLLKNEYANVIKKDVEILKATAELYSVYTPLNWHRGLEIEAEDGDVNKLNKFYLDDASTAEKIDIEVVMQFSYAGLDETFSYRFYCFEIEIVKATNEVVIECFVEESFAKGTNNSSASYHSFKLTGVIGDSKEVSALNYYAFERNTQINNPSTADNNTIKNFEGCKISKDIDSVFYLKENSDSNLAKDNSVQTELTRDIISRVNAEISQIPPKAFKVLEEASSLICPLVNA